VNPADWRCECYSAVLRALQFDGKFEGLCLDMG
jgi:hypothetical protein